MLPTNTLPMFSRRLSIALTVGLTLLFTVGCLDDGKLSIVEYNNAVVTLINDTSAAIEESTESYDNGIPNIVTETTKVDTTDIEAALTGIRTKLETAVNTPKLLSVNTEQQTQVEAEFSNYLERAAAYADTFEKIVNYYKNGDYKKNLDQVAPFDRDLHNHYNEFIQSNNTLIDILAGFVK